MPIQFKHYSINTQVEIAGTPYNRWMFFCTAKKTLECLSGGDAEHNLNVQDIHCILQMLCSDFPIAVVKNAYTPAILLQSAVLTALPMSSSQQQKQNSKYETNPRIAPTPHIIVDKHKVSDCRYTTLRLIELYSDCRVVGAIAPRWQPVLFLQKLMSLIIECSV